MRSLHNLTSRGCFLLTLHQGKESLKFSYEINIKQGVPSLTSTPPSTTSSVLPTDTSTSSTPFTSDTHTNPSTTLTSTTPADDQTGASTPTTTTTGQMIILNEFLSCPDGY